MLVLDTHTLVWWVGDSNRLSAKAADAIKRADRLAVSAIVFWEISLLVRKRRLDLGVPVREWAGQVQMIPRLDVVPLSAEIALSADSLDMHADPVDRFIVATAILHETPVVTKDRLLRSLTVVRTIW